MREKSHRLQNFLKNFFIFFGAPQKISCEKGIPAAAAHINVVVLRVLQLLQLRHEGLYVLELTVYGGVAHVGNRILLA